jgi:hypothetical protein
MIGERLKRPWTKKTFKKSSPKPKVESYQRVSVWYCYLNGMDDFVLEKVTVSTSNSDFYVETSGPAKGIQVPEKMSYAETLLLTALRNLEWSCDECKYEGKLGTSGTDSDRIMESGQCCSE